MADANVGDIRASLIVDLSQWTRGLQTAASQLQTFQAGLTGRVNPALAQTSQALTTTGSAAQAMAGQMTTAARSTSALSQVLQTASAIGLATSLQGAVTALVGFARETVTVGARLEGLRASLSALSGSTSAGQAQFDSLFQSAQRLGVAFEPMVRGWRTLTAAATQAGLPLSDQRRLLEAVAREGRLVGASNEELSRAFQALGQMASKQIVTMEELRGQLGEALPRSLSAMATGLGVTTAELIKLVEAGSVSFPSAAKALTRGLEEVGRSGQVAGDTLTTAFTRFGNELSRTRDELTKAVGPMQQLIGLAGSLLKVINDSAAAQRLLASTRLEESRLGTGLRARDIARLTPAEQKREAELPGLIAEQEAAQNDPSFLARFGPNRAGRIAELKAEQDALRAKAQALKVTGEEQEKATAQANRAKDGVERQAGAVKDLTTQLDALDKARANWRAKAALAPELFGAAGSAERLKGEQAAMRPGLEKLSETMTRLPAGVTVPPEVEARTRTALAGFGAGERAIDALQAKQQAGRKAESEAERERQRATREAEQERQRAAREALQEQEQYQSAIDKTRMALAQQQDTAVSTLDRLASAYQHTGEQQDRLTAAKLAAQFPENEEIQRKAELVTALSAEAEANREAFNAIKLRTDALAQAAETEERVLQSGRNRIEQMREEIQGQPRESTRLRQQLAQGVSSAEGREQAQTQLAELEQLERLKVAAGLWRDVSFGVGSAWSQALQSIADHTKTVGEAFKAMGKSILQTFADIAAQQATMAFFKLGMGLLTAGLTGGIGGAAGTTAAGGSSLAPRSTFAGQMLAPQAGFAFAGFQHGGVITAPTMAMLGEGPASTLPEYVMNRGQMDALMSRGAAPAAAPNTTVILVDSRRAAEEAALRERAKGTTNIVVQEVVNDLGRGESSPILRTLRSLQR